MTATASIEQFALFGPSRTVQPRRRPSATLRKSNGQFLAAGKAGKLWRENALVALRKYVGAVRNNNVADFTFEDFRTWCEIDRMPAPASPCSWGALPAQACRMGLCKWTGRVQPATRPASHNRLIKVWTAL